MLTLKRLEGETEKDFALRLMKDAGEAVVENSAGDWPLVFRANFIEPGLVYYQDLDMTLLVRRPALDKMRASFPGRPVVNEVHREVTGKVFKSTDPMEQAEGVVSAAWTEADGWDHASFIVWDDLTKRNCLNGYSVSCAYVVTEIDKKPGIHHNIPYDGEILSGEYTHLAVVRNPRYEGATIIANSEGGIMKLFKWLTGKDKKTEIKSAEGLAVEHKGAKVPLNDLITAHNALEAKKAAANPPTPPAVELVNADETVEVDGKPVKVADLVNAYETVKNAEADEKAKKDKEEADEKERKNAEDKAAADKKEKDDLDEKERKNALSDDEKKRFEELQNAAARRGEMVAPKVFSREEQLAEGSRLYGSEAKK